MEALISLGMLSVVILILIGVFAQVRSATAQSDQRVDAAFLGHSLLSQQRQLGFDALTPLAGVSQELSYRVEVDSLDAGRKRVSATVTWRESTGAKTLVVETLVADL